MSDEIFVARPQFVTRRNFLKLVPVVSSGFLLSKATGEPLFKSGAPFSVDFWPHGSGNFRALVHVPTAADAVYVRIPWRRRDADPQLKGVFVQDARTSIWIENVFAADITGEYGDVVFQPPSAPADYYLYYMQYTADTAPWAYAVHYLPPASKAAPDWLNSHGLRPGNGMTISNGLPKATFREVEARTDFDSCDPMELVATREEVESLVSRYPSRTYLIFPEDRQYAIRMQEHIPLRWVQRGAQDNFHGQACRNEFFAFQIGLYATNTDIERLAIEFEPLQMASGGRIPKEALRCFNLGGSDWEGRPFEKTVSVEKGRIQALWIGVQIPETAQPGDYHGTVRIKPASGTATDLHLSLTVEARTLPDSGDRDLWRYSRLRWLDSGIGLDGKVTAPYTPLTVHNETVDCLLRSVQFAADGLPASIRSRDVEILSKPIRFVIETATEVLTAAPMTWQSISNAQDSVVREYQSTYGSIRCTCRLKMEFDGYVNYAFQFESSADVRLKDIRLEIPFRSDIASHLMGMGKRGGAYPGEWKWKWDIRKADNCIWLGNASAGLQCKLKGQKDTWDSADLRADGIPASWGNQGEGGCDITEDGDSVIVRAYSGPRTLKANEPIEYRFGLLPTPVKPLDAAHWNQRYYHAYIEPDLAAQAGANIINIHQGNELNPYINYPFLEMDRLSSYVSEAHSLGLKVKIYYTVRELTNRVAELWALRSLGAEIYKDGPGGGSAWLREHLVSNYTPAWHQSLPTGELDSAILTTGLSRWHNYYLRGLKYLLTQAEIDGLYLDGIGYDRTIMQRVRRVLDETRPGSLIDLHSGDAFGAPLYLGISPANQYMEHFPYINSLWFGEGYNYDASPDYWLVEISGIPFGLFGEMLEKGGNPWRGMIYGMTARFYEGADPGKIWEVWDRFGIQHAAMIGYWEKDCPVKTDHKDVLATVYKREDKCLISIASWAPQEVACRLEINWTGLGFDPEHSRLTAPAIPGFQESFAAKLDGPMVIEPGRGFLLILEKL